ncbi:uncharacterized protein LOC114748121 [Neltuma alba]|uniref:uncharacterized protein LOC114748121 n=1 Tax=Neltuma alba TaxID=207710 RepID=UPI0010A3D82D|nr:uncharacterized protein LOC114748121 [Prosopis alba]
MIGRPPSLPIIGNLHLLGERPHRSLQSLAKIYGPIMSLKLGQVPAVVVSSPEAAGQILKTHDAVFASRPKVQSTDPFKKGVRGVAFAEYGPYWRYVRKLCTLHLLSASRVEMFAPLRKEEVGATVKRLERAAAAGEVVDVSEKVGELLENMMYRMVLGRRKDDRFQLRGLMNEVLNLVGQFNIADYIPWLAAFDLQGLTRKLKRNRKALDDALEKIIAEHELALTEPNLQHHKDFISILLSLLHQPMDLLHNDQDHTIDRPNLTALLLDMILAATDTSSVVIEWALSELLRDPRVMKDLQNELQEVVGMKRMVEEVDLVSLSYLDMVIKETLRLHPPGPFLIPRESMKDDVIVSGYCIRKKTRILVNVWAIGRDPKVWSDNAHLFYPERFVDSNIDVRGHDFQLLPFGSGRRGCAGTQLGLTTVKLALAQLVHCFNWELPRGVCPGDLDMNEKFGLTIPRTKPLLAIPTYRLHRPPGPMSLPIIGNLHMLGELPYRSLQSLAQKYGPIMSFKLGQVPAVVVSSPEAAKLFLKTHDTVFASRPHIQASDPLSRGTKGLVFAEYGPYWRYARKVCTLHLLSASRVEIFAPLRREELGAMVKLLDRAAAAREVVDLSEVVGDVIENIIYRIILGRAKDDRLNLKGLITEGLILAGQFNLVDFVPWLGVFDLQGLTGRLRRNHKALDGVLEKIVREHEEASKDHKDFMNTMLSLVHDQPIDLQDEQNHVIDRPHLRAILIDMIFAATDTSSVAVDWVLSELFRNPRVMKTLQNELKNAVGRNRIVEEGNLQNRRGGDLAKLSYLDIFIKETLRLHPPAPLTPRESTKDVTVNGYYIRKKTRIIVNVWAIGRDPKIWSDDASLFYPERFLDRNIDIRGHDYELLPFGSGRRTCPGIQMGLTTVKIAVAQLAHCFNWELPLNRRPSDLDMNEEFGLTVPRTKHLLAVPTYRLSTECPY